jgi:hypothetical protein
VLEAHTSASGTRFITSDTRRPLKRWETEIGKAVPFLVWQNTLLEELGPELHRRVNRASGERQIKQEPEEPGNPGNGGLPD